LTIHELQNEATTPAADDYAVLDRATAGTRKITLANLATWIHNKWASFVHACTAITSFASGDEIAVVNGNTAKKMSKDTLLQLTSQNALAPFSKVVFEFEGAGYTPKTSLPIPIVQGEPIVVLPSTTSWGVTSINLSSANKLAIVGVYADGTTEDLRNFIRDEEIPRGEIKAYTKSGMVAAYLFFRADVGESVSFNLRIGIIDSVDEVRRATSTFCANDTISCVGFGNTLVSSSKFIVIPGVTYKINVLTPSWDVSNVTASARKFYVRWYDSSGSPDTHNLVFYTDVASIPNTILVKFPKDAFGGDISIRANSGEEVKFSLSVASESITNEFFENMICNIDTSKMMCGDVTMSSSSMSFQKSFGDHIFNKAIFYDGAFVDAKAGDFFELRDTSNYSYYIAYSSDGLAPYTVKGWLKTRTTFESDCKFTILLKTDDTTQTELSQFASLCVFKSSNTSLQTIRAIKEFAYGERGALGLGLKKFIKMDGAGTTSVVRSFDAEKNSFIRLKASYSSWACDTIGNTYNVLCVRYYNESDEPIDIVAYRKDEARPKEIYLELPKGCTRFDIFFRADVGESVEFEIDLIDEQTYKDRYLFASDAMRSNLIKSVNHRGYNQTCPENTLPAYRESARRGFHCVETDIQLTADHKWVCIHDSTIDRTSDHTGNVSDYTLAQLKTFDFGSWKSSKFAGTKIPTFEEFICTCKRLGLDCYVEIKSGSGYIGDACDIVKIYGMEKQVTWISFNSTLLNEVKTEIPVARLGYILNEVTQAGVTTALSLKTSENEVFVDAATSNNTAEIIALLKTNEMPVEFWTMNNAETIAALDPYVSGVTSDAIVGANVIFEAELNT
jgi:glycerophosphoryl diester phosphodiesterase